MRVLRGLAPADWDAALAAGGLDPAVLARACATLSKGMLQRVALLEAVQAGCPLLLLDEPFAGLDDAGRDWLAAELAGRMAAGAAVLFTDHSGRRRGRLALAGALLLAAADCRRRGARRRPGARCSSARRTRTAAGCERVVARRRSTRCCASCSTPAGTSRRSGR